MLIKEDECRPALKPACGIINAFILMGIFWIIIFCGYLF